MDSLSKAMLKVWNIIGKCVISGIIRCCYGRLNKPLEQDTTAKPVLSGHSKRTQKIGFQYRLSLNAGQKYCRMLQGEHSAIRSTSIKLPFLPWFCIFLSDRLRQVLLYSKTFALIRMRKWYFFHMRRHFDTDMSTVNVLLIPSTFLSLCSQMRLVARKPVFGITDTASFKPVS